MFLHKPYWQLNGSRLYQGHVLDVLAALEAQSVHMVATSPPYWGLRDYGLPPVEWPAVSYAPMAGMAEIEIPGCAEECVHVWVTEVAKRSAGGEREYGSYDGGVGRGPAVKLPAAQWCQLCGGWRGCLGLEPTVEMFVGHLVLVWRALWRVLRDDGCCWLNLGDSYSGGGGYAPDAPSNQGGGMNRRAKEFESSKRRPAGHLKPKDLIGVPWRVAFALQADGWYLRSDIIWAKGVSFCPTHSGSCMPESVRDRPTKGHEHVFLVTKNKRYFYDGDAVRESYNAASLGRYGYAFGGDGYNSPTKNPSVRPDGVIQPNPAGRNLRTVWTINPGNFKGAHFATFPTALVEPMIKAGTSAKGCCPECGAPWRRVTEKEFVPQQDVSAEKGVRGNGSQKPLDATDNRQGFPRGTTAVTTTGWRPTCDCYDALYRADFPQAKSARKRWQRQASGNWWKRVRQMPGLPHWPVDPCTVLDPFLGSGTTADVARQLGRNWVGIELSKPYCDKHIIPRLTEPLFEWAEQVQEQKPEPEQLELL